MKVTVETIEDPRLESAHLRVTEMTEEIRNAVDLLEHNSARLTAMLDGQSVMCPVTDIYYLESVDKKTFLYLKDHCLETRYRLYELEEMLNANFFRCSKSMIVNLRKIRSVKSEFNGRMNATLLNGEEIVISRSYVKELKKKLGV